MTFTARYSCSRVGRTGRFILYRVETSELAQMHVTAVAQINIVGDVRALCPWLQERDIAALAAFMATDDDKRETFYFEHTETLDISLDE